MASRLPSRSPAPAPALALTLLALSLACATARTAETSSAPAPRRGIVPASDHDGPADGLALRAERGSIDRDDAEDAIMQRFSDLKRCYEQAGPAVEFAEGAVTLRFEVEVDGRTSDVTILESRLGNHAVERCLAQAGRAIRFPRPHGHARASFEYSMEFRSTRERAVMELPPEATDALRPGVLARLAADCGALGVPSAAATLYVDRRGQVHSAGLAGKAPIPPAAVTCAVEALARAPLPPPAGLSGDALGRATFELSDGEVLAALAAPPPAPRVAKDRPATQGRRRSRR